MSFHRKVRPDNSLDLGLDGNPGFVSVLATGTPDTNWRALFRPAECRLDDPGRPAQTTDSRSGAKEIPWTA